VVDPLAQFQHTAATKEEILKLVKTLNSALEGEQMPDANVEKPFERWWPELEKKLQNLPPDEPTKIPHRDDREILTELVGLTRQTSLSVLESHRQIIEKVNGLENTLSLPPWQGNRLGQIVNMRASSDLAAGNSLYSAILNPPFVPGGTSETPPAQMQLRQASQRDEIPPSNPPDIAAHGRKDQAENK
jgi:hypothetical protein